MPSGYATSAAEAEASSPALSARALIESGEQLGAPGRLAAPGLTRVGNLPDLLRNREHDRADLLSSELPGCSVEFTIG